MKHNKLLIGTLLFGMVGMMPAVVIAGTEYYTDENGFTQERWVDDSSNSDSGGYESESDKSYFDHARETVKEAWDHMNDQGKARQIQDELEGY